MNQLLAFIWNIFDFFFSNTYFGILPKFFWDIFFKRVNVDYSNTLSFFFDFYLEFVIFRLLPDFYVILLCFTEVEDWPLLLLCFTVQLLSLLALVASTFLFWMTDYSSIELSLNLSTWKSLWMTVFEHYERETLWMSCRRSWF